MERNGLEPNPNLLTVPETACFFRVKPSTVRKWKHQGRFPHVNLGRRVFFRRSDLESFVAAGFVPAAPKKAKHNEEHSAETHLRGSKSQLSITGKKSGSPDGCINPVTIRLSRP
jgi:excisionase family DNA binding protein